MWILDWYITRRFLVNFVILLLLLFVFAVAIDFILQLDEFMEAARALTGEAGVGAVLATLFRLAVDFYGPRIFQFYAYMVGLVSVAAMGFTYAQMHGHRELVAVLASGVRLHRVALPVLTAAFALNLVQLANQELFLPELAPRLIRTHGSLGRAGVGAFEVPFTNDGRGNLLYAPSFDPESGTLRQPTFLERDEAGRCRRRITAELGQYDHSAGGWRLSGGRAITPRQAAGAPSTQVLIGQPVDLYRTDLTPQVLTMRRYREFATMLSLAQIRRMMDSPGVVDTDALDRFFYGRFATVLINLIVLVISLPFFLLREPASLMRNSVLCATTVIPAMLGALLGFAVALPGIPPALGVFLPAMVMAPVALYAVTLVRT